MLKFGQICWFFRCLIGERAVHFRRAYYLALNQYQQVLRYCCDSSFCTGGKAEPWAALRQKSKEAASTTDVPTLLFLSLMLFGCVAAEGQQPPLLTSGQDVEGEINGGEKLVYLIDLKAGQFLRAELKDRTGDNAFKLLDPNETEILSSDLSGRFGIEPISYVATTTGRYKFLVIAEEFEASAKFSLNIRVKGTAEVNDLKRFESEEMLRHVNTLRDTGEADKIRESISVLQKSIKIWQSLDDKFWESHSQNGIGLSFLELKEYENALKYYGSALEMRKSIGDIRGQALSIYGLSEVAGGQDKFDERIQLMRKAIELNHSIGNLHQESALTRDIADLFKEKKEFQKALNEYHKAASIANEGKHYWLEASILSTSADVHYTLNQTTELAEKREKAASIFARIGDKESEADEYKNIGWAYLQANEYVGAKQSFERAIKILGADDERSAGSYWGLADISRYQSEMPAALANYEKAATVNNSSENPAQSAGPLEDAGRLVRDSGDLKAALAFFQRAMPLRIKQNDDTTLGSLYSDIGLVQRALGNKLPATEAFKQALIHQMSGDDGKPLGVLVATPIVERALARQKPPFVPYEQGKSLTAGMRFSREVKAEDFTHDYRVQMEKGEFLHIELDQHNIDIVTTVIDKKGAEIAKGDRSVGDEGFESLLFEAKESGEYHIRIRPLDKKTAGSYDLWVEALRKTTTDDQKRVVAENLYKEGVDEFGRAAEKKKSSGGDSARSRYLSASQKFIASRNLFRELGDVSGQEAAVGAAYRTWESEAGGERHDVYARELLTIVRLSNDHDSEFNWLKNYAIFASSGWDKELAIRLALEHVMITEPNYAICNHPSHRGTSLRVAAAAYSNSGKKTLMMEFDQRALKMYKDIGDQAGVADVLHSIGRGISMYAIDVAIENFEEAAKVYATLGNHESVKEMFNNICGHYVGVNNAKAVEFCQKAIEEEKKYPSPDRSLAASSTSFLYWRIGEARWGLGDFPGAIEHYELGLKLDLETTADVTSYKSRHLFGLGRTYLSLGDRERARAYFEKSKSSTFEAEDSNGPKVLAELASFSAENGEWAKAIEAYDEALTLSRKTNRSFYNLAFQDAEIIARMTDVHLRSGDIEKAAIKIREAEALLRNDLRKSGLVERNYAHVLVKQGKMDEAEKRYMSALFIFQTNKNLAGEAEVLSDLMTLSSEVGKPHLAVFFGKASVNVYQRLRATSQSLDAQTRKLFAKSVEKTYRNLSKVLIEASRLTEAVEVINAFKDQRAFDFDFALEVQPLTLTNGEDNYIQQYEESVRRKVAFADQIAALRKTIGIRLPNPDESGKLNTLEVQIAAQNDKFLSMLKQGDNEFARSFEENRVVPVQQVRSIQDSLLKIGQQTGKRAVAVYQVGMDERLSTVIVTHAGIRAVNTPIKAITLGEKARKLWALLQTERYDPRMVSKEVYDVVFAPIEKEISDIEKQISGRIDTILWSLDGDLRYVPMGALFDGNKYLVERYNHVNFTRADMERMMRPVSPKWTATGLGTSDKHTVSLLGESIPFNALPGVTAEFEQLFKKSGKAGILDGEILQDANFDQKRMLEQLKMKRPVVHIASHFSFRPGDEARSFLLMGDGKAFTLADMKKETNMFAGVEMLTLSACNTAAQQADANGREIDGFAELAQRLGANSVMATLWPVADTSTPWLMREFYSGKLDKKLSKAESLRQAQLSLLKGSYKKGPDLQNRNSASNSNSDLVVVNKDGKRDAGSTRAETFYVKESDAPRFRKDEKKPFAHPYYWSPFILFGNWQ